MTDEGSEELTLDELDDYLCAALMATRHGRYDGLSVESHLERLLDKVRAAKG